MKIYDLVDECLGKSKVLERLGYGSRVREEAEQSEHLSARTYFHVVTGEYRCLTIGSFCLSDGDLLLTFEICHTMLDESFMLEDWSRKLRNSDAPYPFLASSYSGDLAERINQIIYLVENLLVIGEIEEILKGRIWKPLAPLQ